MSELTNALIGNSASAPPAHVVEALDEDIVHRPLAGAPHTIYEEIWHLAFWQEVSLAWIGGSALPYPEHASVGFPSAAQTRAETWNELQQRFLRGTVAAAAASEAAETTTVMIECPTSHGRPARIMSIADQLISLAAHNAYHLGRVVLLRQIAGAWPPPSGGDTW